MCVQCTLDTTQQQHARVIAANNHKLFEWSRRTKLLAEHVSCPATLAKMLTVQKSSTGSFFTDKTTLSGSLRSRLRISPGCCSRHCSVSAFWPVILFPLETETQTCSYFPSFWLKHRLFRPTAASTAGYGSSMRTFKEIDGFLRVTVAVFLVSSF